MMEDRNPLGRRRGFQDVREDRAQDDFGFGLQRELFADLDAHKHTADVARCVWVKDGDVDGDLIEGGTVTALRALNDWCLRSDDGTAPIAAGTALVVVETRPYGAAMVRETVTGALIDAARELQADGLFEVIE